MWNENVKIVFVYTFVKSGLIHIKPKSKWSPAHSTHIEKYISSAKMLRFHWNITSDILHEIKVQYHNDNQSQLL